ncbi:MAG: transcription-repair coupling factor [Firmicutes bacterium]|nr:transcription-repair coupling factor [Bacillota bacterium]
MIDNMFFNNLKNLPSYNNLIKSIEKGTSPISINGLSEENISHVISALKEHTDRQILFLSYNEIKSKKIIDDLKFYNKNNIEIFPSRELVFYDIDAHSHEISNQRIKVLNKLSNDENVIVVVSINSFLNKITNKELFNRYGFSLEFGEIVDLDKMRMDFDVLGYERVDMLQGMGQYSIRGGIIDFFPVDSAVPYRVELFDDEIDSIRKFDIKTQRSIENVTKVKIAPAREILVENIKKDDISKALESDLKQTVKKMRKKGNEIAANRLEEKFNYYIDRLRSGVTIDNMDMFVPYIHNVDSSIIDYLKEDAIVIIDEPRRIEESVKGLKEDFVNRYTDLFERGEVLPKQENINHSYDELIEEIQKKICVTTSNLLKTNPHFKPKEIINFISKGMQSFHNKLDLLAEQLNHYKYRGYKVIILSGVEEKGRRLQESLIDKGLHCQYVKDPNREIKSSQIIITEGSINRGFEYPRLKFAVISDKEVFGVSKKKRKKKKRKEEGKIESFTDLNPGDYIVHESHGIGKYIGIEQLKVQGIKKDYLTIKYHGEDKLYVPVDQMNLIQKYIGADSIKPKVNKLGSSEWTKTKNKAKKAIEDMAQDLIKLYAKRQTVKGFAFSKDQPWQKQFEDIFPYEETDDQLKCIEQIKRDMEKSRPMDRLLCGDVGYGKTEVALRAAFKAVLDSKQVAFLVPTTILAQQHYNTLVERFSQFPVKVEMLSRFRNPGQQRKIINDLKSGNIDIIVGTHRLLSKDVKFLDLGLLIVDEEQRFGVKHKESLKTLKESIDVLTLTATPIPRTLHMSMIGIRDMSVIEEPPEERYPVQTYVVEHNRQLIRDAVVKEINRGGQIYVVYNRVKGIRKVAAELKELVPEARIAVGHGQMNERELEKVMVDFLDQEYDVLVCTTIIETGLDIPNVNTIIIYDSDKMGLSQLYQLRGRVGRSNRLAFAYLTYQRDKVLSEVAEKRLKAIKEFTEFGSGFKIAMRDLEIRGAGNLLGQEQHGHMAAIGYDLYVKYLEQTVRQLNGEIKEEKVETTIELNVDGYIPDKYIQSEEQKIEMYKRISSIENKEEISDVVEELIDRFGDVPTQVDNLIKISYIKSLCQIGKISALSQNGNYIKIEFLSTNYVTPQLINLLTVHFPRRMNFDISNKPKVVYRLRKTRQNEVLTEIEEVIEKISSFHRG